MNDMTEDERQEIAASNEMLDARDDAQWDCLEADDFERLVGG